MNPYPNIDYREYWISSMITLSGLEYIKYSYYHYMARGALSKTDKDINVFCSAKALNLKNVLKKFCDYLSIRVEIHENS
jgi:hypothetical protein